MMRDRAGLMAIAGLLLMGSAARGQGAASAGTAPAKGAAAIAPAARLTFEVASVRPSPPLDPAKMQAAMQSGKMPRFGVHVEGSRAEYDYMSLKDLIANAYAVKAYQITGPDWLGTERFDIVATMPEGASADDAPKMLQALLEERFKLAVHRDTQEHPVLALVVAKGGPKMKEAAAAEAIDEDAPLKPGEMKVDTPNGPARVMRNPDGTVTFNMGKKGTMVQRIDMQTQTLHLEASSLTMEGLADMLTQVMQMGGSGGRQVVDMTELKGNYQVTVEFSLADLFANARAQGMNVPGAPPGVGGGAGEASDPSGNSTVFGSVQKLGLRLEARKAPVEQLVVDKAEKTPTEN